MTGYIEDIHGPIAGPDATPDMPKSGLVEKIRKDREAGTPNIVDAVSDAIGDALGGDAYDCRRVWAGWSYGTMGPEDFAPVRDDPERMDEIALAALEPVKTALAAADELADRVEKAENGWPRRPDWITEALAAYRKATS